MSITIYLQIALLEVEPRGFEPLTSGVQMRPDESATVRFHPKCAANTHILVDDIGPLVRPIPLDTAWVGVGLVSRLDYIQRWHVESLRAVRSWSRIGEGRR